MQITSPKQLTPLPADQRSKCEFSALKAKILKVATNLLLAQLADLLLHHGDLPVHTVHILDELLLGESSRHQIQVRVHMHRTNWGDGLQFSHGASTLLQWRRVFRRKKKIREQIKTVTLTNNKNYCGLVLYSDSKT